MAQDTLLNVNNNYDNNWKDSALYEYLSNNYMINNLEITLNTNETIHVKKYNIIGNQKPYTTLTIYESNGEHHKKLHTIPIKNITKITTLD